MSAKKTISLRLTKCAHKKRQFISAYIKTRGLVVHSAEMCNVSRNTVWDWRQKDPAFNQAMLDVETKTTEFLEDTAYQRAVKGSDLLTIFLLKAKAPEKYRDEVKMSGQLTLELNVPRAQRPVIDTTYGSKNT